MIGAFILIKTHDLFDVYTDLKTKIQNEMGWGALCSNPTYLQLLLLVSPNDFEFTVDHGGLSQVQGVGGHQRERGRGPSDAPVRVQGGRACAGRSHGPVPRRAPSGGAAHAGRGRGKPGGVPENLPIG